MISLFFSSTLSSEGAHHQTGIITRQAMISLFFNSTLSPEGSHHTPGHDFYDDPISVISWFLWNYFYPQDYGVLMTTLFLATSKLRETW